MKELILVRHAKSSWEFKVGDLDRPLNERGIHAATLVSATLKEKGIVPDAVFTSNAVRALHTCAIFQRNLAFSADLITIVPNLYDFTGDVVLNFIKGVSDAHDTIMIFGHNHAFTHLANALGSIHFDNVPTSGVVHIKFDSANWASILKGTTIENIFPKEIR